MTAYQEVYEATRESRENLTRILNELVDCSKRAHIYTGLSSLHCQTAQRELSFARQSLTFARLLPTSPL